MTAALFSDRIPPSFRLTRIAHQVRAHARQISAFALLSFVVCHLLSHTFLIVSIPLADEALGVLMKFWWSHTGTLVLAAALAVHLLNALWAIFIRRYLRMPFWEWAQIGLGLLIPPMIMMHVVGTKISDTYLGTSSDYLSVLTRQWVTSPWIAGVQIIAVVVIWLHACIGLHFWLRTTRWYARVQPILAEIRLFCSRRWRSQVLSRAAAKQSSAPANNPEFVDTVTKNAHLTPETRARARANHQADVWRLSRTCRPSIRRAHHPRRVIPVPASPATDPRRGKDHGIAAGRHRPGNAPRQRNSPRLRVRRTWALHDLPYSGCQRAGHPARASRP